MALNIILFDNEHRERFLPLTYTRPLGELRIGILTIREKWEKHLDGQVSYITQDYLSEKYPLHLSDNNFLINGAVLPSPMLVKIIKQLDENEALLHNEDLVAARLNKDQFEHLIQEEDIEQLKGFELDDTPFTKIQKLSDLFKHNEAAIQDDFDLITRGRTSAALPQSCTLIGPEEHLFIEESAWLECASINVEDGPVYIGHNSKMLEGARIRGAFALCDNAVLKMDAKIYKGTTIGPYCKVGGEISNSILTGFSNKGHDGYLGNSVLGEWCNLGADTNTSNLKNNYSNVKLWDYNKESFVDTGEMFCGLIMGDHSKCGINTMFNTGTVVGVSANIFGAGYPRNFIPSFAWGGHQGFSTYKLDKVEETAKIVMGRRNKLLTDLDRKILKHIFELSAPYRNWEKA